MLRNATDLLGHTLLAQDGEIGRIEDLYFDEQEWTVRYLVVNTGGWFSRRQVLISPTAVGELHPTRNQLTVSLTRQQVKNSPPADENRPVSRQYEQELHTFYGWEPYWMQVGYSRNIASALNTPVEPGVPGLTGSVFVPSPGTTIPSESREPNTAVTPDSHLHSLKEVTGYHIHASDGEIGHVQTITIDDANWVVLYLVVDTGNWLPGKKVMLALEWIDQIDWRNHQVHVSLRRATIADSPEYDPDNSLNRDYEKVLYDYYGRPGYWHTS
jgi:sporulation protein YlmC with PRC-barrel domain